MASESEEKSERISCDLAKVHKNTVLVLMKTLFNPSECSEDGLWSPLNEKMDVSEFGGEEGNLGLAYMLYRYSIDSRLVEHSYLLTGISFMKHPRIIHWGDGSSNSSPVLSLGNSGYNCKVMLAVTK